jgi:hypothetical protein
LEEDQALLAEAAGVSAKERADEAVPLSSHDGADHQHSTWNKCTMHAAVSMPAMAHLQSMIGAAA